LDGKDSPEAKNRKARLLGSIPLRLETLNFGKVKGMEVGERC
jgi:hypothetical protein